MLSEVLVVDSRHEEAAFFSSSRLSWLTDLRHLHKLRSVQLRVNLDVLNIFILTLDLSLLPLHCNLQQLVLPLGFVHLTLKELFIRLECFRPRLPVLDLTPKSILLTVDLEQITIQFPNTFL
jgi:hypothetical protein